MRFWTRERSEARVGFTATHPALQQLVSSWTEVVSSVSVEELFIM